MGRSRINSGVPPGFVAMIREGLKPDLQGCAWSRCCSCSFSISGDVASWRLCRHDAFFVLSGYFITRRWCSPA